MTPDSQVAAAPGRDVIVPEDAAGDRRSGSPRAPGPRVLFVDDNEEFREAFAAALSEEGVSVVLAAGAVEAAERVASERFDAAIIDLVMPGRHGLAFLADLRAMPAGRDLPSIVLSALPKGDTREQARQLVARVGGAALLDKPVTPRRLLVTLGRLIVAR